MININLLFLSAALIRGHHSRTFFFSFHFVSCILLCLTDRPHILPNYIYKFPLLAFPFFSYLAPPTSALLSCIPHIPPQHMFKPLSLTSLSFSPNLPTCAVPLMYPFLILSNLVTPNKNHSIFSTATLSSISCFLVHATVSKPYSIAGLSEYCAIKFSFHFRGYPPVANYSCHFSPPTPSCKQAPFFYAHSHNLHYFAQLTPNTWTRPPWPPVLLAMHCATAPLFIHTHVLCIAPTNFHSPSVQCIPPRLQVCFNLQSTRSW